MRFTAMASPCEVLVATTHRSLALELATLAATEAWRIERKFSRYRDDSVVAAIHRCAGESIALDPEAAALLEFAAQCYELSGGRFDITSGILRRAWKFDGSDRIPAAATVTALLRHVGFDKLQWRSPSLTLPSGMELDFGGIGKEYAVDRAHDLLQARCDCPFLVNFGGDLRADRKAPRGAWQVGVEQPGTDQEPSFVLELERGALTTSGDARRFLLKDGQRYGHILDPRTGWPVPDAPRSVTVAANTCTEAGLLSTLAMLHGRGARAFLAQHAFQHWVID